MKYLLKDKDKVLLGFEEIKQTKQSVEFSKDIIKIYNLLILL